MIKNAKLTVGGDAADFDCVEPPLLKDLEHFALPSALGNQQHALLRFAEHDFIRSHSRFALWYAREVNFNPQAAARSHLGARAGEAGWAHILNRDDRAGGRGLQAGFGEK